MIHLVLIAEKFASFGQLTNPGTGSKWNPERRNDNGVWVSVARVFGMTVPQLTNVVGMKAPPIGASVKVICDYL